MSRKVHFCGALNGSVTVRDGETDAQAMERAEQTMLDVLERHAKRLNVNVGLEPDEGAQADYEARQASPSERPAPENQP